MKLALFGGTFDPPHNGHIALCEAAAGQLGLDRVVLMPTAQPPHKLKTEVAPAADRLHMCRLLAENRPLFTVSDMEILRGGASFTVDTLRALHEQQPDAEWYLLTGADMFLTLRTWWHFEDIAKLAVLCTVPRGDASTERLRAYARELEAAGALCRILDMPAVDISSTEVRGRLRQGSGWESLVPAEISEYIRAHGLYTGETPLERPATDEQYIEILRRRLTPYRFEHSLNVAKEAKRLARLYGADEQKAYTAGLLHDILKDTPPETQLQMADDFGILLDTVEQQAPNLWHARVGAGFLQHILGVRDSDILNGVRYHTTARAGMSLLEKILYIADFTAEGRTYPDVDVMRRLSNLSLEQAMIYSLHYLIHDLEKKGRAVHPNTLAALHELEPTAMQPPTKG